MKERLRAGEVIIYDELPLDWFPVSEERRIEHYQNLRKENPTEVFRLEEEQHLAIENLLKFTFDRNKPYGSTIRLDDTGTIPETKVHIDAIFDFLLLIYLSEPYSTSIDTGTAFLRHKQTGWNRATMSDKKSALLNSMLLERDHEDLEAWEVVREIPFKKNRGILFDPRFYHSPSFDLLRKGCPGPRLILGFYGSFVK